MSENFNKIICDILVTALDSSEIYDSAAYGELSRRISEYSEKILEKTDEDTFERYQETRIDMESLFYKFGFIEGVRFAHKLMTSPPDELVI